MYTYLPKNWRWWSDCHLTFGPVWWSVCVYYCYSASVLHM